MTNTNTKYKVTGLYYTKPFVYHDAGGEVHAGRSGINLYIGGTDGFGFATKEIIDIQYDESLRAFRVFFKKGGLKVIPYLPDTEVTYEEVKA